MKYNFEQNRSDYLSPLSILIDVLTEFEKALFDLDTCCSFAYVPARKYFVYGKNDGLKENWSKFNWCNPPFNECSKWIKKAYNEQQKGKTTVMLIPVRTETKYWHDYILFNPNVKIKWLRKGYKFINAETHQEMGVFKNALALVYFFGA